MTATAQQLPILPVVLPLVAGALLLLLDERRNSLKSVISFAATLAGLCLALVLLCTSDAAGPAGTGQTVAVYRLGNWPPPFGIVLVVDRLSALMLALTSVLALAVLTFSLARWQNAGAHFHSLFQFLILGLNGAFLTGDLFNLFVFFEVLLAASYGLVLHGSGRARVLAGMHYIAINLGASSLFLIGVSLIYGVSGTLNMADIAARVPLIGDNDRMLFEAGAAILGIAFLVKAGIWPLGFWLPGTYSAALAPVAAFFAIMTKLGIYIILRLSVLILGAQAGASAHFGSAWLFAGGLATVVFGSIGVLAAQGLPRLASYCVVISSGTLLAAIGIGSTALTEGAIFYLLSSTLSIAALFMLVELIERGSAPGADVLAVTLEAYGEADDTEADESTEVGVAIPATMAILGASFAACAVLLAGLPPLSGFVAKFLLLEALLQRHEGAGGAVSPTSWALIALLLVSGFAAVVAMVRAGIRSFWMPLESSVPRVRLIEIAPIVALLVLCAAMTVGAAPVLRYVQAATADLQAQPQYIREVLSPALRKGGT